MCVCLCVARTSRRIAAVNLCLADERRTLAPVTRAHHVAHHLIRAAVCWVYRVPVCDLHEQKRVQVVGIKVIPVGQPVAAVADVTSSVHSFLGYYPACAL